MAEREDRIRQIEKERDEAVTQAQSLGKKLDDITLRCVS